MTELSKNLLRRREELGMSQEDLRRASGVSMSSISAYERSDRKPKARQLMALANALRCSPADLDPYYPFRDEAYGQATTVQPTHPSVPDALQPLVTNWERLPQESKTAIITVVDGILSMHGLKGGCASGAGASSDGGDGNDAGCMGA